MGSSIQGRGVEDAEDTVATQVDDIERSNVGGEGGLNVRKGHYCLLTLGQRRGVERVGLQHTYDGAAETMVAVMMNGKIAAVNFILMVSDFCRKRSVLGTEEEVRCLISVE